MLFLFFACVYRWFAPLKGSHMQCTFPLPTDRVRAVKLQLVRNVSQIWQPIFVYDVESTAAAPHSPHTPVQLHVYLVHILCGHDIHGHEFASFFFCSFFSRF